MTAYKVKHCALLSSTSWPLKLNRGVERGEQKESGEPWAGGRTGLKVTVRFGYRKREPSANYYKLILQPCKKSLMKGRRDLCKTLSWDFWKSWINKGLYTNALWWALGHHLQCKVTVPSFPLIGCLREWHKRTLTLPLKVHPRFKQNIHFTLSCVFSQRNIKDSKVLHDVFSLFIQLN